MEYLGFAVSLQFLDVEPRNIRGVFLAPVRPGRDDRKRYLRCLSGSPASPFLQFIGKDISYTGVGDFLVGLLGFFLAAAQMKLQWQLGRWIYFVICVLSGALIQMAVNWIGASLCFWTTRSGAAVSIAERFTVLMQQYPVNIFGKYFQIFVTCFLPVAFINYYPSVVLLDKAADGIRVWQYFAPLVSFLMLAIAAFVWRKGVKRYAGTGN